MPPNAPMQAAKERQLSCEVAKLKASQAQLQTSKTTAQKDLEAPSPKNL